MAKKRRAKRGGSRSKDSGLADGVKQSILAICLGALAVLFLFSFLGLTGDVGLMVDRWLAALFGWDRWLFALVLIAIGWNYLFPSRQFITTVNYIGLVLFFIAFNGMLNLFIVKPETVVEDLPRAGGYVGLLVSQPLVGALGFWGALVIAFAVLCIAIVLTFNVSVHSIATAHQHFTSLGALLHRRRYVDEEEDEEEDEEYEDEEEDVYEEEGEEEMDEEEDDDEEEAPKKKRGSIFGSSDSKEESLMTSRKRRKIRIPLDLLDDRSSSAEGGDLDKQEEVIRRTFENFGIDVEMVDARVGPTVTQYALRPAEGVKLSRIVALQDDLALALAAHPIRIEAPIPGRSLVGIEVPNQKVGQVCLQELLKSKVFKKRKTNFTAPLGRDVAGDVQMVSVDKAPHMLVAGATGSGKSVCLNDIIISLLYQNGPDDLKLIMVDPKRVELGVYAGIPHLLVPPITKAEEAINALKWAVREMERRLDHLAKAGVRDIDSFNEKSEERMPKVVIIIDELADLMSTSKRDVEAVIVRIAQMARAAGIHLVLATQRPSVDVITGLIKANIPTRIALAVASQVDSKTIIDQAGAEKLLGRGDMLLSTPSMSKPHRVQGAYVSDKEIERVIDFLKKSGNPDYNYQVTEDTKTGGTAFVADDADDLMNDAIEVVIESGKASTSFLQRRLKIGYSRAARIVDMMEEMGVIGEARGSKPREVLVEQWPPVEGEDQPEEEDEEELAEEENGEEEYLDEYQEDEGYIEEEEFDEEGDEEDEEEDDEFEEDE